MRDPYQTLGVERSASTAEIKGAYRKLAKKFHPDLNPGRKDIEQKFKEISAAYDLLSDAAKKARFDRGEIDDMGNERGFTRGGGDPFGRSGGPRSRSYSSSSSARPGQSSFNPEDIFAEFFGGKSNRVRPDPFGGGEMNQRGVDISYTLEVPFVEASKGGKQRVTLANGKTIDVNVPPGTKSGDKLRLRGLGQPGSTEAGDALVEIRVMPHPFFTRDGNDIYLDLPISLPEAVSGAGIKVPTLDGYVTVKVPQGANAGTTLRLKGKGIVVPRGEPGDMFVKIKIVLPDQPDSELNDFIEKWSKKKAYDPRKKLGWG
jgi:DnaJ-class molecular chaperone